MTDKESNTLYNCHSHVFSINNVPEYFLPPVLKLLSNILNARLETSLRRVGLNRWADMAKRYYQFKEIGKLGKDNGQEGIFKLLTEFYPSDSKFVVLSMDMEFMGAGKVPQPFIEQLEELGTIKKHPKLGPQILPFVFAHPERENVTEVVKYAIEKLGFAGIKIYPALGYFPDDKRLQGVYEYANEKHLPIITHCSRGGVFYKGELTEKMRTAPDGTVYPLEKMINDHLVKRNNDLFTEEYSDPARYIPILKKYKNLKLCYGHFGGETEWNKFLYNSWNPNEEKSWYSVIKDQMTEYDNVYADISYNAYTSDLRHLLNLTLKEQKRFKKRVLYGSDYYMLEMDTGERAFSIGLRSFLGEKTYWQIAHTNAERFLKTKQ